MVGSFKNIILIFMLGAVLMSCNKDTAPDCFKKAGIDATVSRMLTHFDTIELKDYIQIQLVQSEEYKVEITAPINVIPKIRTAVENGVLTIENGNTCNFVRSFKHKISVRIYAPHFYNIQNRCTGDISTLETVHDNYFKIENHHASGNISIAFEGDSISALIQTGVSDITITGEVFKAELFNQGLGKIDAEELRSNQAYINNSSINDIYAWSEGYVFSKIVYSGNVYLRGTPDLIDRDISGSGEIIFLP